MHEFYHVQLDVRLSSSAGPLGCRVDRLNPSLAMIHRPSTDANRPLATDLAVSTGVSSSKYLVHDDHAPVNLKSPTSFVMRLVDVSSRKEADENGPIRDGLVPFHDDRPNPSVDLTSEFSSCFRVIIVTCLVMYNKSARPLFFTQVCLFLSIKATHIHRLTVK